MVNTSAQKTSSTRSDERLALHIPSLFPLTVTHNIALRKRQLELPPIEHPIVLKEV